MEWNHQRASRAYHYSFVLPPRFWLFPTSSSSTHPTYLPTYDFSLLFLYFVSTTSAASLYHSIASPICTVKGRSVGQSHSISLPRSSSDTVCALREIDWVLLEIDLPG